MHRLTFAIDDHLWTAGAASVGLEPMLTNVDARSFPRPFVKWSYEPASPQDVPRALSQAIHIGIIAAEGTRLFVGPVRRLG